MPRGRADSSRTTRRGRNQTSCRGRTDSVGGTWSAYAIQHTDSSAAHDDSKLFRDYSQRQVETTARRRGTMAKKSKSKKRPKAKKAKRAAAKSSAAKKKLH